MVRGWALAAGLAASAGAPSSPRWGGTLPFLPHGFYTDTFVDNDLLLKQKTDGFSAAMPWQNTPKGKDNATWATLEAWLTRCDRVGVRVVWDLSHYVGFGIVRHGPPLHSPHPTPAGVETAGQPAG